MEQVGMMDTIHTVLKVADAAVVTPSGFMGVAVQLNGSDNLFDGTLVYFPGIPLEEFSPMVYDEAVGTYDESDVQ